MPRLALIFTALTIVLGARAADARQGKPPTRPTPQVLSLSIGPRAKPSEVRRLVGLVGVVEKELASIDTVMGMFRRQMPSVPERTWAEVKAEFAKSFNRETIIEMYVPIYSAHFNAAEIRSLIAFYSSPVGRRLVTEAPLMEKEAFFKGVERGLEIGERLRNILKAKGYNVPST